MLRTATKEAAGCPRVLGWGRATALHSSWWCWLVGSRDLPSWIPAFAGITMASRRPHKKMKMMVRRAVQLARTSGPS